MSKFAGASSSLKNCWLCACPVQQSISNALYFFCDLASVFSKQDFPGSPKHVKKHYICLVESLNHDNYVRQAATQIGDTKLLTKLSERDMIASEAFCHEDCMTKFRKKFCKFSNNQENHVKNVQNSLEAIAVAECMSFIEDSLQSSDEVAPFIQLPVIPKLYCHCLESTRRISSCNNTERELIKT